MVIHPYAKTCKKSYKFDLEVKVQGHIWIKHVHVRNISFMVIHPCAKYGKPMTKQKKVMGWTQ